MKYLSLDPSPDLSRAVSISSCYSSQVLWRTHNSQFPIFQYLIHLCLYFFQGWEYSALLFIACNTLALAFITFSYAKMLRAIKLSSVSLRSTHARHESAVARRFAIIVFTDCLCWLPIIIVKIIALCGKFYIWYMIIRIYKNWSILTIWNNLE